MQKHNKSNQNDKKKPKKIQIKTSDQPKNN